MSIVPSIFKTILSVKSYKHFPDNSKFNLNIFQEPKIITVTSLTTMLRLFPSLPPFTHYSHFINKNKYDFIRKISPSKDIPQQKFSI